MTERDDIVVLRERVSSLEARFSTAMDRIERMDSMIRQDFKEIKEELVEISGWMNRSKGWAAAVMFIAGGIGGLASAAVWHMLR